MMTTPTMAATALRTCVPCSHNELVTILHQLQGLLQNNGAMSDKCTSVCVDMLDEVVGQIEQDQINQVEDVPGFQGTYASLGALTIRAAA